MKNMLLVYSVILSKTLLNVRIYIKNPINFYL